MRRLLAFCLLLAMVLGFAAPVHATEVVESGTFGQDLSWVLSAKGILTISGTGSMQLGSKGDSPWYEWKDQVKSVVINEGVTDIGYYAFYEHEKLRTVTIPKSVTVIRNYAFHGCGILTGVVIPNNVTSIGYKAFYNCDNLTKIIIPDSVTYLGWYTFGDCDMLNTVRIGSGLTYIENGTFYSCCDLWQAMIPATVTRIEQNAFKDCNWLDRICFGGTRAQWKRVWIVSGNDPVKNAAYHYDENCDHLCDYDSSTITDCFDEEGDSFCDLCGKEILLPVPAKPYKIVNVVSGVHVYWKAVEEDIKQYALYRSEKPDSGYYRIATTTATHLIDETVVSGKTYYYKVASMSISAARSEFSVPVGITYVETPDITSRFNKAAGITLGWNKIQGATGYAIYRKSYSGSDAWVRVATITGNATFTWQDTSVKNNNGTAYRYTVRALAGSDRKTLSGCRNMGRTMVRLSSRSITSAVKASATSIKCSWTTSSAVTGYEVRFMIDDQVYRTFTVGNYKTGVKTFTGLPARLTYKIQVRSYVKIDGMGFYSAWSSPKTVSL